MFYQEVAAQTATTSGGAASDAGSFGNQQTRTVKRDVEKRVTSASIPVTVIPPRIGGVLPPNAEQMSFTVSEIQVTGSSVYNAGDLAQILRAHEGRVNTLGEVYGLAEKLAEKYRADGYAFTKVTVPGQYVGDRSLKIEVEEFRIGAVDFDLEGRTVETPNALRASVEKLLANGPARTSALEAVVAAARDLPEYQVATTRARSMGDGALRVTAFLLRRGAAGLAIQPVLGEDRSKAEPDTRRFRLERVSVTGVTAIDDGAIAKLYSGLIGTEVAVSQAHDLADRIAGLYTEAGYYGVRSEVPPQVIRDGALTIEITELGIDSVAAFLNGDAVPDGGLIDNIVNAVTERKPLRVADIERQIFLLRKVPGLFVESVIPPDGDGEAKVYLRRKPWTLITAMDNRGTPEAGSYQVGFLIQENGQLGFDEQIQLYGLVTTQVKELQFLGGTVVVPLTSSGLVGAVTFGNNVARPTGYLASSDIRATGSYVTADLTYPIFANAKLSTLLTAGFDLNNSSSSALDGAITASDERSRTVRFGTLTTLTDDIGGLSTLELEYTHGIDGLGARPTGDQVNTRPGMRLNGSKVSFEVTREQQLPQKFKLSLAAEGQYAFSALPAAQVFTFGGVSYGRAYDSGILSGDHGIAAKAQLSRPIPLGNPYIPLIEPYVFYDIGQSWSESSDASASAASTGLGTRFFFGIGVGGSVELDVPLTHLPTFDPSKTSKDPRIFFLLFAQF